MPFQPQLLYMLFLQLQPRRLKRKPRTLDLTLIFCRLSSEEATNRMKTVFKKGLESKLNAQQMEPCRVSLNNNNLIHFISKIRTYGTYLLPNH